MHSRYQSTTLYERTVHTMFGTALILSLMYCIVLLSLVFSVIERKQNIIASRDLTSEVSALETRYANKVASINENTLSANNYVRVNDATFAVRKDNIASYTVLYAR